MDASSEERLPRASDPAARLTDERKALEARTQGFVGETGQHAVDHADGVEGGSARRVLLVLLGVEPGERSVRQPELGRVADRLGDRPRLVERSPGLLPPPGRARRRAREPPRFDQVLARVRARGEIETSTRVTFGLFEIVAGERQLALARGESDRVAEAHPGARRGIAGEAVDAIEHLAGESVIAPGEEDVAEIELGVRQGARVRPAAPFLGAASVELGRAVEVAQLEVEPAEAVEQPVMNRLVSDLPGELQTLTKRRERGRVVTLAGQGQSAQEGAEEQWEQQVVLARDLQPTDLQLVCRVVVRFPTLDEPGDR